MEKNTKDIIGALEFIKERMATREDVANFATKDDVRTIVRTEIGELVPGIVALEVKPIVQELRDIDHRLDALERLFSNLKGVTKEIDDLRDRVRAIEKHLGLNKKIAA
jgi:hypothetical protein